MKINVDKLTNIFKKIIGVILILFCIFLLLMFIVGISETEKETTLLCVLFILILIIGFIGLKLINPKLFNNNKIVHNSTNNQINMSSNKFAKKQKGILKSYIIEFPFFGVKEKEQQEKYFDGKTTYKWFNKETIENIKWSWNDCNMLDIINNKVIKNKIDDIQLYICCDGTCKIILSVYEELTDDEKKEILEFVQGQTMDGWGEGNFNYINQDNEDYSVIFGKNNNEWYIKYTYDDLRDLVLAKFKKITEKDCYEIDLLEEETDIKDNKIGGLPYLPIGEEYPKDKSGNMMSLLLQINFKDIKLDNFPNEGILEIFMSNLITYPTEFVVRYYQDNLEYQKENLPNTISDEFIVSRAYKLKLNKTKCHMPYNHYKTDELFDEISRDIVNNTLKIDKEIDFDLIKIYGDEIIDKFYTYQDSKINVPHICIGGYANFTQGDPRSYAVPDKTECVFKIDSQYDFDKLNIGDAGILFGLISLKELKDKEFDKIYVDWDCM